MSFQNCKVAGIGVDPRFYHAKKEATPRGDASFIMSPSALHGFARLPSRWRRGWNPPESKSKKWGNLVDCRTLTPELFASQYAVEPDTYTVTMMQCPVCMTLTQSEKCKTHGVARVPVGIVKDWNYGADFCAKWRDQQAAEGREAVSPEMLAQCDEAVARLFDTSNGDDTMRRWFDCCDRQVLLEGEWLDEDTGIVIPCSALLDFVPRTGTEFDKNLGDFKSTMCANHLAFESQGFNYGYHRQAAFDLDMYNAATGDDRGTWCFIIQENFAPWETNRAFYGQDGDMGNPSFLTLGRDARFGGYQGLLASYAQCLKHNFWPGYNQIDEAVDGWCVLNPKPFMAEKLTFGPRFVYTPDDVEADESAPGVEPVNIDEVVP